MPTVFLILLSTSIITAAFISLLLLFHYCYCHKTVATDKLCRASLLPGAAELTIHLSRLINILWLPLCRINKFGFYFPRRLLRSPILVGHQGATVIPCSWGLSRTPVSYLRCRYFDSLGLKYNSQLAFKTGVRTPFSKKNGF